MIKDIVEEARALAPYVQGVADSAGGGKLSRVPELLRVLSDEVERLRSNRPRIKEAALDAILDCDKCDLCEDHHG